MTLHVAKSINYSSLFSQLYTMALLGKNAKEQKMNFRTFCIFYCKYFMDFKQNKHKHFPKNISYKIDENSFF